MNQKELLVTSNYKKMFIIFSISLHFLYSEITAPELTDLNLTVRPFQTEGETLKFEVHYTEIVGGKVTIKSTPLIKQKKVKLELWAHTLPWLDSLFRLKMYWSSVSDLITFESVSFLESKLENKRSYFTSQTFNSSKKNFVYQRRGKQEELKRKTVNFSGKILTILDAFYYARMTELKDGAIYQTSVAFENMTGTMTTKVLGREEIETPFGRLKAVVTSPQIKVKGFLSEQEGLRMYLSDDKYKIPLLLEFEFSFGSVKATLIDGYPSVK